MNRYKRSLRSWFFSVKLKIGVDTVLRYKSQPNHQLMCLVFLRYGCFPLVWHAELYIAQQQQSAAVLWGKTLWIKERSTCWKEGWGDDHNVFRLNLGEQCAWPRSQDDALKCILEQTTHWTWRQMSCESHIYWDQVDKVWVHYQVGELTSGKTSKPISKS